MSPKQAEQFNRMRKALLIIAKHYQTPAQLRRADIGLSYEETLEGAYENIRATAADAVRGVRGIEVVSKKISHG